MVPLLNPASATLADALERLRGPWKTVRDGILEGRYCVWAGSAVSRDVFPDLGDLLYLLIQTLQKGANHAEPNCPFGRALHRVLEYAGTVTPSSALPIEEWPEDTKRSVLRELIGKYAQVLGVQIELEDRTLSIVDDVLELPKLYADPSCQPDAEHRLLAVLVAEGVFNEIITTNWDTLIETAGEAVAGPPGPAMQVVVSVDDMSATRGALNARLMKLHGCARRAVSDPDRFRPLLVATKSDLLRWTARIEGGPIREAVRTVLRERASLFVGLSVQDWDLQLECARVFLNDDIPYSGSAPRLVFAEQEVGENQALLLEYFHKTAYVGEAKRSINQQAAVPLYAKPLLAALYVEILLAKLSHIADLAEAAVPGGLSELAASVPGMVEAVLIANFDAEPDPALRWRRLAQELPEAVTRLLGVYREAALPSGGIYHRVCSEHIGQIGASPHLGASGYPMLLLCLALLLKGQEKGLWSILSTLGEPGAAGQFGLDVNGRELRVFVVADDLFGPAQLDSNDLVDLNRPGDLVVIHPRGRAPAKLTRVPKSALPGRSPRDEIAQIWMGDHLTGEWDLDDLLEALRYEFMAVGGA
jgi:hypothetical protein